ncbi:MAG: 50S ribosome-binding GTPase [Ilumatobacteraceae bacterium]|nr:50S ribosome-binding GTPase [Ilumatobacteraceae bacterium]
MILTDQASAVIAKSQEIFASSPAILESINLIEQRLEGPLRVAIAGKVKAGKSTLMNALVGERLAATDVGECTKVVTWYLDGHTYQVMLNPKDGSAPVQARFHRDEGALDIDLGGRPSTEIDRIEVTWPSKTLRQLTLIDTPGIDSLTESIGTRAFEFLDPEDRATPADAVLYLMRHIHGSDLRLLEAFHDDSMAEPNPVNTVAVLSRADEIGAGRLDSMASSRRIAKRLGADRRLKRLVQVIVPVAGLLAETAASLTEWEYKALRELASVPPKSLEPHLLSADRFISASPEIPLTSLEREELLGRFGLFGIRLSLAMLRRNVVESSAELAAELGVRSGVSELLDLLTTLFVERTDVLKARSALLAIETICTDNSQIVGSQDLLLSIEETLAGAHPFAELRTIAELRSDQIAGSDEDVADLERTLGSSGTMSSTRLGIDDSASASDIRDAAITQLGRWQRLIENPFTSQDLATAARVAVRSLEGILAVGQ